MRHTKELRCPYLSFDLISQTLSIKYEDMKNKQILKGLFNDIVPDKIIKRKKEPLRYRSPRDMEWRFKLIDLHRKGLDEYN